MNLELKKLQRDLMRVTAAKIDQEIALEEALIKIEQMKKNIASSEEAIKKLEAEIKDKTP